MRDVTLETKAPPARLPHATGARLGVLFPLLGALAVALGCAAAGDASSAEGPLLGFDAPTTDGRLAMDNLEAELRALTPRLDASNARDALRRRALDMHLLRNQVLADPADLEAADALAGSFEGPGRAAAEAAVQDARHEWDAALAQLPADGREAESIALARGADAGPIVEARRARAESAPGFSTWLDLAAALNADGRYEDADAAYREALAAYGGISPFPVAFVQFARGVMWAERAGRPELARPLYEEAVRRSPFYTVAQVHLAELEAEAGELDAAIARLEGARDASPDPEAPGLLGELVPGDARAASLVAEARATYDALLRTHRRAYVDHATEFFLGPGDDASRALELALENLANRDTERARDLAIRAAEAAGEGARACTLAAPYRDAVRPVLTAPLAETLATLGC
ncbi:MAG: tetratricopeptide repeat protein [Myxococcota bacterium]